MNISVLKWWLCNCVRFISKCIDGVIKSIRKIGWVDGWSVESDLSGLSYVVKVAAFGHKHHQGNIKGNSNESNNGVSIPSILHLTYEIYEIGVTR